MQHAPKELLYDSEIALMAVNRSAESLRLALDLTLRELYQFGRALRDARSSIRDDREFVLQTVNHSTEAFNYAPDSLLGDREFALEAL